MSDLCKNLVVLCEGDIHTLDYLMLNKVYPSKVMFDIESFINTLPYLTSDDEILVIIHGLTDFTLSQIYGVLASIQKEKDRLGKITVMSNLNLGKIETPYFIYTGDLFYGDVFPVLEGKLIDTSDTGDLKSKMQYLFKRKKEHTDTVVTNNDTPNNKIMLRFKGYDDKTRKVVLYGGKFNAIRKHGKLLESRDYEMEALENKVVALDLFKKQK